MTRRRLRLLALGALVVAVLVAMFLEPAWVARNTVSLVGLSAVMLWAIARDFVMGVVSAEDYDALTSWLFAAGRRDTYPVAQVAIVALQGCSHADSRKLRGELRAARRALAADGVYVERTSWEAFADRLDEAPFVPEGEDDLFRLAVLGQLDRGREHIVTKVSELRKGGNEKAHALALVLEWMASGSTDDAEMDWLAERLDPDDAWAGACCCGRARPADHPAPRSKGRRRPRAPGRRRDPRKARARHGTDRSSGPRWGLAASRRRCSAQVSTVTSSHRMWGQALSQEGRLRLVSPQSGGPSLPEGWRRTPRR